MTRKALKIFLILAAFLVVAFSVLVYLDTRVMNPPEERIGNTHYDKLESDLDKLKKNSTLSESHRLYTDIMRQSEMFEYYGYITNLDKRVMQEPAVAKFSELFCQRSLDDFVKPVWSESDLAKKKQIAGELQNTGYISQSSDIWKQLGVISSTIDKYYEAKNLASNTSYLSVGDAEQRIGRAKTLAGDTYLKHCRDMVERLGELPAAIHNSHYAYINRSIPDVENTNIANFTMQRRNGIQSLLNEYRANAQRLYGNTKDLGTLENRFKRLSDAAAEWEEWEYATQGNTTYDYNTYLRKYPNGRYANEARSRIANR